MDIKKQINMCFFMSITFNHSKSFGNIRRGIKRMLIVIGNAKQCKAQVCLMRFIYDTFAFVTKAVWIGYHLLRTFILKYCICVMNLVYENCTNKKNYHCGCLVNCLIKVFEIDFHMSRQYWWLHMVFDINVRFL